MSKTMRITPFDKIKLFRHTRENQTFLEGGTTKTLLKLYKIVGFL